MLPAFLLAATFLILFACLIITSLAVTTKEHFLLGVSIILLILLGLGVGAWVEYGTLPQPKSDYINLEEKN